MTTYPEDPEMEPAESIIIVALVDLCTVQCYTLVLPALLKKSAMSRESRLASDFLSSLKM